jgi:tetratricopeptide (TPR) repeat protein
MNAAARDLLGRGQSSLAGVLVRRNQIDQSLQLLRESQAQLRTLMNNCPDVPAYRSNLVSQYNALVDTLIRAERWEEAEAPGQEAVLLCTQLPANLRKEQFQEPMGMALERLAIVQRELNKLDSALESYSKSLELHPSCVFCLSGRGHLHERLGNKDEALADLKRVVELAPSEITLHNQLGIFYYNHRQYEAAAQVFAKIIELNPGSRMGYGNRGETLVYLGRYEEALADLTQALKLDPKNPDANSSMAWLLVAGPSQVRDPQKGAAMAESGVVSDSAKSQILGAACYQLGHYGQAKNALTDAIRLSDEHSLQCFGERLLFLAMACQKLGHREEAYKWFAQAETWIKENAGPQDVHLQNIRREATALLAGLAAKLVVPEDNGPDDLDPNLNRVVVAQEPSSFEIRLYSSQELPPASSEWQGVTMTRDGQPLQAGLDYDLRYDPAYRTLVVEPVVGVFEDAVYRISFPPMLSASQSPPTGLVVSVCSLLPTPQHVTFRNSRAGYSSAKYEPNESIELVPRGEEWRYLDDGSDPGVGWRELDFDDSGWKTGRAQLGYGDGDESTELEFGSDGNDKYPAAYFRRVFRLADPARIPLLRLELLRDDGAAVYLNGKEIVRDKLPHGAAHSTYASGVVAGESESVYVSHTLERKKLLKGDNCLAVEIHQSDPSSSDMSFDLQLGTPPGAAVAIDNLFGEGPGQIPHRVLALGATLRLILRDDSPNGLRLSQITNLDHADTDSILWSRNADGIVSFDVKHAVQAWCDGEPNLGWFLLAADKSDSLDGVEQSPELTVNFIASGDLAPLAWHFANCADAGLRDPKLALEYAQRAVKSLPEDPNSRTALGAALYRNGQRDEAITVLERALEQDSGNQHASTILAMAYAECGRQEIARELLSHLPGGRESRGPRGHQLSRLREEAERLLTKSPDQ